MDIIPNIILDKFLILFIHSLVGRNLSGFYFLAIVKSEESFIYKFLCGQMIFIFLVLSRSGMVTPYSTLEELPNWNSKAAPISPRPCQHLLLSILYHSYPPGDAYCGFDLHFADN